MNLSANPYDDFQPRTVVVHNPGMREIVKDRMHDWPSNRMANEFSALRRILGWRLPLMLGEFVLGADGDGKIHVCLDGIGKVIDAVPGKDGVWRDAEDPVL